MNSLKVASPLEDTMVSTAAALPPFPADCADTETERAVIKQTMDNINTIILRCFKLSHLLCKSPVGPKQQQDSGNQHIEYCKETLH